MNTRTLIVTVNLLLVVALGALGWLLYPLVTDALSSFATQEYEETEWVASAARQIEIVVDSVPIGQPIAPQPPTWVELGGRRFQVVVLPAENPPILSSGEIGWQENTIINYIFQLPASEIAQLQALSIGMDQIIVTLGETTALHFGVSSSGSISSLAEVARQNRPMVTVAFMDDTEGFSVNGDYIGVAP